MEHRWQRTRVGLGVALIAAGIGVYGARWWLQEQLPLLEQWPVLLIVAPALTLGGASLIVAARPAPDPRSETEMRPDDER